MIQNKKRFLVHLLVVVFVVSVISIIFQKSEATGGSWKVVGSAGFSTGEADFTSLAVNSKGVPYMAFTHDSDSRATVMKFNGTKWENVGNAKFSVGEVDFTSLAFDSKDTPYIAFEDFANNYKATVMKFNGTKWVNVGTAGFSAGSIDSNISLAINSYGFPHVAYMDDANNGKITVMKYTGTKWVNVGKAGFSAGQVFYVSLAFDLNNIPYVVFQDDANGNKATAMKYNGSNWVSIGKAGFSGDRADYPSIVFDSSNTPYVAFGDAVNNLKATVMKFDGSAWSAVGSAGFSGHYAEYVSMKINPDDSIYVGFKDISENGKATVMKYEGIWQDTNTKMTKANSTNSEMTSITTDSQGNKYVSFTDSDYADRATVIKYDESSGTWSQLGTAGFTPDRASWTSLAFDTNDTPYIAYSDMANPNPGNIGKASVMKYDIGTNSWKNVGPAGFSTDGAEYTKLAIDKNNIIYVAFVDHIGSSNSLTTMKYNSTINKWEPVGVPGFSKGAVWYPSLTIDNNNIPYVAYTDQATGKAQVMKFDGRNWAIAGQPLFSTNTADYPVIKFDQNNTAYVSFQDWANNGRLTVMTLNNGTWKTLGNPGFSRFTNFATSLAIYKGIPYVSMSYVDATYPGGGDGVSAMKYNSRTNKWNLVGNDLFSSDPTYNTQITVDKFGVPYVSYVGSSGEVKVLKFD